MTDKPVTERQLEETAHAIRRFIHDATRAVLLNNPSTLSTADFLCCESINKIFNDTSQV